MRLLAAEKRLCIGAPVLCGHLYGVKTAARWCQNAKESGWKVRELGRWREEGQHTGGQLKRPEGQERTPRLVWALPRLHVVLWGSIPPLLNQPCMLHTLNRSTAETARCRLW